ASHGKPDPLVFSMYEEFRFLIRFKGGTMTSMPSLTVYAAWSRFPLGGVVVDGDRHKGNVISNDRYVDDGRPLWQHIVSSSMGCFDSHFRSTIEEIYNNRTAEEQSKHVTRPTSFNYAQVITDVADGKGKREIRRKRFVDTASIFGIFISHGGVLILRAMLIVYRIWH
ncbi:hypothetical protein M8C21_028174, partial [Ambrosia artemisiifolia]